MKSEGYMPLHGTIIFHLISIIISEWAKLQSLLKAHA